MLEAGMLLSSTMDLRRSRVVFIWNLLSRESRLALRLRLGGLEGFFFLDSVVKNRSMVRVLIEGGGCILDRTTADE